VQNENPHTNIDLALFLKLYGEQYMYGEFFEPSFPYNLAQKKWSP
jgi:hypothetical protein